ncbi:MAG: hypothetical protein KDD82_27470 [Planctomycetes bacterium]|nr:hypothetical protein [Planctomycetota bacterium]
MRYAVLLGCVLAATALADKVHLNDGRVVEGDATWINGGTQLRVRVKLGSMTFERAEVARVVEQETPSEAFTRRLKALRVEQLAARVELGRFAHEHDLEDQAAKVWIGVATFRPSEEQLAEGFEVDAGAVGEATRLLESELDYHLHEGRWLPPEEYYPAIGYVRHKGMWIPKEIADLRDAREDAEKAEKAERAEARQARREREKLLREASERVAAQSKRLARLLRQVEQGKRDFAQLQAAIQDLSLRAETSRDRELVARLAYDQWRISGANDGSARARQTEQLLLNDLVRAESETRRVQAELAEAQRRAADLGVQLQEAPQAIQREEQALRQAEAALAALEQGQASTPASRE